jgi:DNA-binding IclR family transcriptional regulator
MLREVTEERENQTRIQMQERLATVGQLAAGIAHDFNHIMAAILVMPIYCARPNIQEASQEKLIISKSKCNELPVDSANFGFQPSLDNGAVHT